MDQKKNLVCIALKSMQDDSLKTRDFAMQRCLSGCLKSLEVTSKVVTKIEDLRGVHGFSNAMIQRIEDRFKEGPLLCECTKIFNNIEDLTSHIKSFHQKKKKNCKNPKKIGTTKRNQHIWAKAPRGGWCCICCHNGPQ